MSKEKSVSCGACGQQDPSGFHRCKQCTTPLCSVVFCDKVWMPEDYSYFCGKGCVLEYNDEQNQTAKPVLMPIRRRPHDQHVVSTDVGSSSETEKDAARLLMEFATVAALQTGGDGEQETIQRKALVGEPVGNAQQIERCGAEPIFFAVPGPQESTVEALESDGILSSDLQPAAPVSSGAVVQTGGGGEGSSGGGRSKAYGEAREGTSKPVIPAVPTSFIRVHARDTPRAESDLINPPPVGSKWEWKPSIIAADGADAGPNGVVTVCRETDSAYDPTRGHCCVHVERNVQQKKYDIFPGDSKKAGDLASEVTSMIERVKCHSTTVATAVVGKELIKDYLQQIGQDKAAEYMDKYHLGHKWSLVEMNVSTAAGGGVPCQANPIERKNLDQKNRSEWKRSSVVSFLEHASQDLSQQSMDDLGCEIYLCACVCSCMSAYVRACARAVCARASVRARVCARVSAYVRASGVCVCTCVCLCIRA